MTTEPIRPRSKRVFWVAAAAFTFVILAVVLLANDKRNLKALVHHYQLDWFDDRIAAPTKVEGLPKTEVKQKNILVPAALLDPDSPLPPGEFLRKWRNSGPTLCDRLNAAGISNKGWQMSGFDAKTSECIHEPTAGNAGDIADAGSFFLIVRGTTLGEISMVRMKIVLPPPEAGGAELQKKLVEAYRNFVEQAGWLEFADAAGAINRLDTVDESRFGAAISFSHEFENPRAFNFFMTVQARTPGQRRTRDYFDTARWLPSADEPLAEGPS
ncbi:MULTISPECIES: DUF6030 family protein [unclassified Sinorhizobium]|uniref:DUF6030 family protein n=1 Tax=unclassified Sinorhizobium TaxID=2613772 RepID=UPI0035256704